MSGSATAHLVTTSRVALSQMLRPAFAPVRRAGEVRAGLASAVDEHDGPGVCLLARDLELGVHLATHHLPVVDRRVCSPGKQVALPRDG